MPISPQKTGLQVEYAPVDNLVPYERNARTHSPEQVAQIAASIREFGWTSPILVDAGNGVVAGHGRLQAAISLGMGEVPIIRLAGLTEGQRRALVLADNKLALNAGWDFPLLQMELAEIDIGEFDVSLIGFSDAELEQIATWTPDGLKHGRTDPEAAPEPPAIPVSALGDVWLLGAHRLLCGDATSAEDVAALMSGTLADLVFTDPPYGVGYSGGAKLREKLRGDEIGSSIYADALPNLRHAAADHAALYLWYADAHAAAAAAAAAGYVITAQIIWVKNNAQFVTSAHYKGKHEPCYYAHRRGKSARWVGQNNEVTVWEVSRAPKNEYHPTQKPVELAARAIGNSSIAGDVVLDLFMGSGSTIIAAEQTGRRGYGLEIAPAYVDVSLRRWQDFTGGAATLEGDGRTFAEVAEARIVKAA